MPPPSSTEPSCALTFEQCATVGQNFWIEWTDEFDQTEHYAVKVVNVHATNFVLLYEFDQKKEEIFNRNEMIFLDRKPSLSIDQDNTKVFKLVDRGRRKTTLFQNMETHHHHDMDKKSILDQQRLVAQHPIKLIPKNQNRVCVGQSKHPIYKRYHSSTEKLNPTISDEDLQQLFGLMKMHGDNQCTGDDHGKKEKAWANVEM
mgnify:FL=1